MRSLATPAGGICVLDAKGIDVLLAGMLGVIEWACVSLVLLIVFVGVEALDRRL